MRARISFRNVPVVLLRYGSDEATLYSGEMQEKDRGREGRKRGRETVVKLKIKMKIIQAQAESLIALEN